MLIVSRKELESILICPDEDVDPNTTLADLFRQGPIEIKIFSAGQKRVTMGVQASAKLNIWRKDAETT